MIRFEPEKIKIFQPTLSLLEDYVHEFWYQSAYGAVDLLKREDLLFLLKMNYKQLQYLERDINTRLNEIYLSKYFTNKFRPMHLNGREAKVETRCINWLRSVFKMEIVIQGVSFMILLNDSTGDETEPLEVMVTMKNMMLLEDFIPFTFMQTKK